MHEQRQVILNSSESAASKHSLSSSLCHTGVVPHTCPFPIQAARFNPVGSALPHLKQHSFPSILVNRINRMPPGTPGTLPPHPWPRPTAYETQQQPPSMHGYAHLPLPSLPPGPVAVQQRPPWRGHCGPFGTSGMQQGHMLYYPIAQAAHEQVRGALSADVGPCNNCLNPDSFGRKRQHRSLPCRADAPAQRTHARDFPTGAASNDVRLC